MGSKFCKKKNVSGLDLEMTTLLIFYVSVSPIFFSPSEENETRMA